MGIRDLLKKKDDLDHQGGPAEEETVQRLNGPEFTFIRSDTISHEVIQPPDASDDHHRLSAKEPAASRARRSLDVFRSSRSRSASASSQASGQHQHQRGDSGGGGGGGGGHRRLSQRLHLSRAPESSENVPEDLPAIVVPPPGEDAARARDGFESEWEKRATMLASQNERARSRPGSPAGGGGGAGTAPAGQLGPGEQRQRARSPSSSKAIDEDIQEAIRLHEEGDLERSTGLFGRLADPNGANNPLSQVLYGLALRHGWGCQPDPAGAVQYLSAAASNAASVEQLALQAGLKKGGAAKGELVLAIFELANCFRHGWGIPKDAVAAKQYYETAANLGDSDAMNETGWCYLEGYGCKKDKFASARYYRLAEKAGNKTLGNSWIWKEKYDPPGEGDGSGSKKKK